MVKFWFQNHAPLDYQVLCDYKRLMGMVYQFIGSLFFRRQQDWERRKNARIMLWTVVVALTLALVIATVIKLLNGAKH